MHQVKHPSTQTTSGFPSGQNGRVPSAPQASGLPAASSVDDLISGAARRADELAAKSTPTPTKTESATPAAEEKPAKKEKSKASRLVYSDSELSPEEKMARLPRYAFVPDPKGDIVLGDATTASVARTVDASEEVLNPPQ